MSTERKAVWAGLLLAGIIAAACFVEGCGTTPARTALTATGIQVVTVDAAMSAWADFVRAGYANPAQVQAVKSAYQHYYNAALAEKAAWMAYASAPTNATPAQVAQAVTEASAAHWSSLFLDFYHPNVCAP